MPTDIGCAGLDLSLSKFLNGDSRDSAAILIGLDDFGDPILVSRDCLFATGADSIFSASLLEDNCVLKLALLVLFPSFSEFQIQIDISKSVFL